jgi:DNA-binding NarL/FixJ family response regulator
MTVRVVFADDNYLVREGVAGLLAETAEVDLVETVADPEALHRAVVLHRPDAVLTDIRMPPTFTTEGIDAAKRIRAEYPETGVVVLSQYVEEDYALLLLSEGVEGLMARRSAEAGSPLRGLTEKEREVLEQMATGRTNATIARTLFMSERSVEKHISSVFLKLGLLDEGETNRRVSAVLTYVEATR